MYRYNQVYVDAVCNEYLDTPEENNENRRHFHHFLFLFENEFQTNALGKGNSSKAAPLLVRKKLGDVRSALVTWKKTSIKQTNQIMEITCRNYL